MTAIRFFFLKLFFVFSFLLSHSSPAFAWGHLNSLRDSYWGPYHLIHSVLDSGSISYCIQVDVPGFEMNALDAEVSAALRLWLAPLQEMGFSNITLQSVSCEGKDFDLKVQIGPDSTPNRTTAAFETFLKEGRHRYSFVQIRSNYIFYNQYKNKNWELVAFSSFAPSNQTLEQFLNEVSVINPSTPKSLASQLKVDREAIYQSTYHHFLHEFGHAFGLCDLYASEVSKNCDPKYMSVSADQVQPESIMNNAQFLYLTPDDIEGIKALATRFSDVNSH